MVNALFLTCLMEGQSCVTSLCIYYSIPGNTCKIYILSSLLYLISIINTVRDAKHYRNEAQENREHLLFCYVGKGCKWLQGLSENAIMPEKNNAQK